jgi:hypothetical protein
MDLHKCTLAAACAGRIHCDCCNDTSPRGTARGRRARQRARAALRGTVRAREKRASAQDGGE